MQIKNVQFQALLTKTNIALNYTSIFVEYYVLMPIMYQPGIFYIRLDTCISYQLVFFINLILYFLFINMEGLLYIYITVLHLATRSLFVPAHSVIEMSIVLKL